MSISLGEDFRRVGPTVPFGEVQVNYEDVLPLHDIATGRFFDAAVSYATHAAEVDFTSSCVAGAVLLRSFGRADEEEPNRSLAIKVAHESEPDGWRPLARIATFGHGLPRGNKLVMYRIETIGRDLLEATKTVAFMALKTEIIIEEDEPRLLKVRERIIYEKPMDTGDCLRLSDVLQRGVKRAPFKFPVL